MIEMNQELRDEIQSMVGTKIGRWTVDSFCSESLLADYKKNRRYNCICDCGVRRAVRYYDLVSRTKKTQSCGCLSIEKRGKKIHRPVKGDKYGNWTIIEEVEKKDGCRIFKSQCACGYIARVRLPSLVKGDSKSCGCLKKSYRTKNKETTNG